jgi:hypothetical protein
MAYYSHHMQKQAETESKPVYSMADTSKGEWTSKDLYGAVNPFGADSSLSNNLLYGAGGALLGYGLGSILDRLRGRRRGESGLGGIGALAGLGLGLGGRYLANSRLADEAQYFDNPEQYGLVADRLNQLDHVKYGPAVSHLMVAGRNAALAQGRPAWESLTGADMPALDERLKGKNAPANWAEMQPGFGEEK